MEILIKSLTGGWNALLDYIVHHTFTCLLPAFMLAGGMVAFVSKEAIIRLIGLSANPFKRYTISALGSFFVAACSCTIIPVASGLYFAGAGLGSAFVILWVAPASNILSLTYTGSIIGFNVALIRLVFALLMAVFVGITLDYAFRRTETVRTFDIEAERKIMDKKHVILLILIILTILAPNYIVRGRSFKMVMLIWAIGTTIYMGYALLVLKREEIKKWFIETWFFIKIIFPLLIIGVFVVGIIGAILPEWIVRKFVGNNSILSSWFATILGQFTYFATMTEAPFVDTMMKLGMAKGPALALLLTGPGMSLPNMLAIGKLFGWKKMLLYAITIMILGTIAGFITGNFIWK